MSVTQSGTSTSSPNLHQWNYSGTSRSGPTGHYSPLFSTSSYQRKWLINMYVFFCSFIFNPELTFASFPLPTLSVGNNPKLALLASACAPSLPHMATSCPHLLQHRIHLLHVHTRRLHGALPAPSCHACAASNGAADPSELLPHPALADTARSLLSGQLAPQ